MKLVTFCNKPSDGLAMYQHSAAVHGWKPDYLGEGVTWFSWEVRLRAVRDYCAALPADEIVVFTDCFDVLLLAPPEKVESAFLAFNMPMVISAERNCWPMANLAPRFPQARTSFRYLCAGTYMGTAGAILEMMEEIGVDYLENCADQMELSLWYIGQKDKAILDSNCRIFQCCFMAEDALSVVDGRVVNSETKTRPLILHANGNHADRRTGEFYHKIFRK